MKSIVSTDNSPIQQSQSQSQSNQIKRRRIIPRRRRRSKENKKTHDTNYARTGNAPISTETHRLRRINLAEFCSTLKSSNRGSSNGAFAIVDNSTVVALAAAASDARRRSDLRDLAARDAGVDDGSPRTGIRDILVSIPTQRHAVTARGCCSVPRRTSVRDDATSTTSRGDAETMRNNSPHRVSDARWTSTRDAVHRWALVWLVHVFFSARARARDVVNRAFRACGLAWCEPRRGLRHAWRRGASAVWDGVARRRGKSVVYDGGAAPGRAPKRVGVCVVMDDDFEDADDDKAAPTTTMEKMCEICEWCATRGVASLMVYDREGVCASVAGVKALECGLRQRGKGSGRALDGFDFVLSVVDACDGGKIKEIARSSRGGSGRIEVCAVGGRDACAALVDAARRVEFDDTDEEEEEEDGGDSNASTADDTTMGTFTYKRDVTRLERWMRKQGTFLPPSDAVIVFGSTFHLDGYPPWQAHAAQLYHEESLTRFTSSDFERIIDRYRSTAQRFGR